MYLGEVLLREIEGVVPTVGVKDQALWSLDTQNGYTVHSLRGLVEVNRLGRGTIATAWVKSVPKKICIFLWRAKLGRIPTRETLDKMGIELDTTLCPRCGKEIETVDHALVNCENVKVLWRLMGRWWNIDVEAVNSLHDLLEIGNQMDSSTKGMKRWTVVVWSTLYLVWTNRNKMIFQKASGSLSDRFVEFQLKPFEWITKRDKDLSMDWSEWLTSPYGR